MSGHYAHEILSDEGWDEWPDLELFEDDSELNAEPDDEPDAA